MTVSYWDHQLPLRLSYVSHGFDLLLDPIFAPILAFFVSISNSAAELRPRHRAKSEREKILNFRGPDTENIDFWRSGELRGEKILNFRGLETKNFDFWRPGEVQGEKILNFRGPETENIDFWRSREVRGGAPGSGESIAVGGFPAP